MAVVVQCYNCSNILELDDGFRGGVCRCSQCGSLLQVPKGSTSDAPKSRPAAPSAQGGAAPRPANPGGDTGLSRGQLDPRSPARAAVSDDPRSGIQALSEVSSISTAPAPVHKPTPAEKVVGKKNKRLLYWAIGLMIFVGIGAVALLAWFVASNTGQVKTDDNAAGATGAAVAGVHLPGGAASPAPEVLNGPVLLGRIPLAKSKVVFSLDGGSSGRDSFDWVRLAVKNSIGNMKADQRFIIAVWTESGMIQFPKTGWASKATLDNFLPDFDNYTAHGAADAAASMKQSLALQADQVIFVTAKDGLDPGIAGDVLAARGATQRLDAIKIGEEQGDSPLGPITSKGGGKFISKLAVSELESLANH